MVGPRAVTTCTSFETLDRYASTLMAEAQSSQIPSNSPSTKNIIVADIDPLVYNLEQVVVPHDQQTPEHYAEHQR